MTTTDIEYKEQRAQFIWMGFIISFFLVQAMVWTAAISITSGDASHAVLADYDEQALKWDQTKSLQHASRSLGWKAEVIVGPDANVKSELPLQLLISDDSGMPVEGADVNVQAFHCGRASEVHSPMLNEVSPGCYEGTLRVRHDGKWQLDGTASLNGLVYLIDERVRINVERKR